MSRKTFSWLEVGDASLVEEVWSLLPFLENTLHSVDLRVDLFLEGYGLLQGFFITVFEVCFLEFPEPGDAFEEMSSCHIPLMVSW